MERDHKPHGFSKKKFSKPTSNLGTYSGSSSNLGAMQKSGFGYKKYDIANKEATQNYDNSDSNNSHREHIKVQSDEWPEIESESDEEKQVLQQTTTHNLLAKPKSKFESQMSSSSNKNYQFVSKYDKSKDSRASKHSKEKHIIEDSIERPKWTIDDFELGKPLGRGKFGQVFFSKRKKIYYYFPIYYII